MNVWQRIVLVAGSLAFTVVGFVMSKTISGAVPAGYSPVVQIPDVLVGWVIVIVVTAGFFLALKRRRTP